MTKETFIKRKHLTGALPTVQRFSPLSSWREARQHAGRFGAGEGVESSYILTHRQQEMV